MSPTNSTDATGADAQTTANSDPGQHAPQTPADPAQVKQVVALLDVVYRANGLLAAELDRLASSRASVSDASVTELLRLADDLRPGAAARAHLAALDPDLQVAGAAEWIARHRRIDPEGELLPTPRLAAGDQRQGPARPAHQTTVVSAANRARSRWHVQAGPR